MPADDSYESDSEYGGYEEDEGYDEYDDEYDDDRDEADDVEMDLVPAQDAYVQAVRQLLVAQAINENELGIEMAAPMVMAEIQGLHAFIVENGNIEKFLDLDDRIERRYVEMSERDGDVGHVIDYEVTTISVVLAKIAILVDMGYAQQVHEKLQQLFYNMSHTAMILLHLLIQTYHTALNLARDLPEGHPIEDEIVARMSYMSEDRIQDHHPRFDLPGGVRDAADYFDRAIFVNALNEFPFPVDVFGEPEEEARAVQDVLGELYATIVLLRYRVKEVILINGTLRRALDQPANAQ